MFVEIRRFRWVETRNEAMRLLVPATDESPQVTQAINAIVQVVNNLDMQMDNTLLHDDLNVNPLNQNNAGEYQDGSGAGGAIGGTENTSSVIPMPDDTRKSEDVNIKTEHKATPSPQRAYKSVLTPNKSPFKEDLKRDKTPAKSKDVLAEEKMVRTPQQEEYRKALSIRDHSKNWYLKERSRTEVTPVPFPPPQANSTYLVQPHADSPKIPQSPATVRKSILHRTVRVQGTFF